MTLSIVCGFLQTLFISPFAGVWADRYDRKLLIVVADSLIALCTLGLALVFMWGYDSIWLLFVASDIRSAGAGIQMPAVNAFLPQFVPPEQLTRVNAIMGMIQSTMTLLSPMLSAALLTVASIEAIFFVDVVTAAIAVVILLGFLRVPPHERAQKMERVGYFADLREGVSYIAKHGYLKAFFLFNAVFLTVLGPIAFLTPLQVARSFGDEVWRLSAIEVGFSLGMLLWWVLDGFVGWVFQSGVQYGPGEHCHWHMHCRARIAAFIQHLRFAHGRDRHHHPALQHAGDRDATGTGRRGVPGPRLRRQHDHRQLAHAPFDACLRPPCRCDCCRASTWHHGCRYDRAECVGVR